MWLMNMNESHFLNSKYKCRSAACFCRCSDRLRLAVAVIGVAACCCSDRLRRRAVCCCSDRLQRRACCCSDRLRRASCECVEHRKDTLTVFLARRTNSIFNWLLLLSTIQSELKTVNKSSLRTGTGRGTNGKMS